jgi:hypothetical protein
MSKTTASAAGGAMLAEGHKSRRAALRLLACAGPLVILPGVTLEAQPIDAEAEILALSALVLRRCATAERLNAAHIAPFNEQFYRLGCSGNEAAAWAYSKETGREDAIRKLSEIDEATDQVFYRMMAIPATTQPGRAAKVRALLVHVMREAWRGEAKELDWDIDQARALLGEFAGMTAEELANV